MGMIAPICYTIGHSDHPITDFIALLKKHAVTCLCDIRSTPYSKRHPQYNAEPLKRELEKHAIRYLYLGKELGGLPGSTGQNTSPAATRRPLQNGEGSSDSLSAPERVGVRLGEGRGEVSDGKTDTASRPVKGGEGGFSHGISLIAEELAKGETIVLMCAEKDPVDCHRSHLVAPALVAAGIAVRHIRYDGEIEKEQISLEFM